MRRPAHFHPSSQTQLTWKVEKVVADEGEEDGEELREKDEYGKLNSWLTWLGGIS